MGWTMTLEKQLRLLCLPSRKGGVGWKKDGRDANGPKGGVGKSFRAGAARSPAEIRSPRAQQNVLPPLLI